MKSAAYVQDWGAEAHRSRIAWSIRRTQYWDENAAKYVGEKTRHADVYVFALFGTEELRREEADPLDLGQWRFYVVPTAALPSAESISLSKVAGLTPSVDVIGLRAAIEAAAGGP